MAIKLPNKVKSSEFVDSINDKFVGLKDKSSLMTCTFNIDKKIHTQFKAYCAYKDISMSELVEGFMRNTLKEEK